MASAGSPPPSWSTLERAATRGHREGRPHDDARPGRAAWSSPRRWWSQRGPVGALVIETPARVEPTEDDLELLALFSSQAAIAIRNSHELERLRSGALAALGRMATQVAHELKNPLAGLRLYSRHLEQRLARTDDGRDRRAGPQDHLDGGSPGLGRVRDHHVRPPAGAAPRAHGAAAPARGLHLAGPRALSRGGGGGRCAPTIPSARWCRWILARCARPSSTSSSTGWRRSAPAGA